MWNWVAERAADRPTNAPEGADRAVTPTETRAIVARASAGGGAALPRATALKFSSLGIDLSTVRVHTDSAAADAAEELGANAFTSGDQIFFAAGQYNPGTPAGDRLIAHELAHVAQHAAGEVTGPARITDRSDSLESAADATADALLSGQQHAQRGAIATKGAGDVLARKPKEKADAKADSDDVEYSLPDAVEDFAIAPDGWSALVRTKWLKEDPKQRLFQMLRQMQRLGAFKWAKEADVRRAAELTSTLEGHDVVRYNVTLRTLAQMGLPPLSGAMVAREGDKVIAAIKVPGLKEGAEPQPLGYDDSLMFEHAVEKFTGLKVANHLRLNGLVVRDGIIEVQLDDSQAAEMFGKKAWTDWKAKRDAGTADDKKTEDAADKPTDVSSEISFAEKMRVEGWLRANLGLGDGSSVTYIDRSTLNVIDEIESDPDLKPYLKQLVEKKMTKPGQVAGTFALQELLDAARTERDRKRLGTDKLDQGDAMPLDPDAKVWDIDGRLVQKGEIYAERETTFDLELDWETWLELRSQASRDEFAKRNWHDEVEWAVERLDKPDKPYATKQTHDASSHIKLDHTFTLGTDEKSGRFKVHAFLRSSHFYPKHFTAEVEVKTQRARMDELEERELADMMDANTMSMNYKFDIGTGSKILGPVAGHDEDDHGLAMSGPLPKDFKHLDPAERLKGRKAELELQKSLAEYLSLQVACGKSGYADALAAAEQRIKFLEETEKKLQNDEASGWTGFEIRATYLSRNADVPSGALDLYGYQRVITTTPEKHSGKAANELPPEAPVTKFELKIRDLSNKIESDLEFTGDGENFDDALREAFVKLAKAYPDGKVAVLAEDMVIVNKQAKTNGRSIGYELGTNSAWKRTKSTVYDPVVQVLANAAAMAVMIIFPPSAAVIVPMLAVADIVNNIDDMVTKHDKGKLTFKSASVDLLQIGLDILPAARGAKILNPAMSAVQEAKGMANMRLVLFDAVQLGGQFIVMYERTKDQLVEIQDKQISTMAEKYKKLVDLQQKVIEHKINPSDPSLAQQTADIEADAKAIRDTVTTTWTQAVQQQATFFVGAHLVGGHEEAAAGQAANKDTHFARPTPVEVTQLRKVGENHWVAEPNALRIVHSHYKGENSNVSKIVYDHETGIAHFEINTVGVVTRIEAQLAHIKSFGEIHGASNAVVGHPIDKQAGVELLQKLNSGDASALATVGITDVGNGKLPPRHEFGIGELPDGTVVLVLGEPSAVDWGKLPGMTGRGHTHPAAVHDLPPDEHGVRAIALPDLLKPTADRFLPREVVFPTGADVIVMAHQEIDGHIVVTSFAVKDRTVKQVAPGSSEPTIVFTIEGAHDLHRTKPDGRKVYKARIVGNQGKENNPVIDVEVWVVADHTDRDGGIYMTEPTDLVEAPPPGWEETEGQATSTAARPKKLTAKENKRKAILMAQYRERELATVAELRELVKLREQNQEATRDKGTPEHMLRAWDRSGSKETYLAPWIEIYDRNIGNQRRGGRREKALRKALDNGNGVVESKEITTSLGKRQVDAATPAVYIELKSGDADLTRTSSGGGLPLYDAILRDRLSDKPVVWVVEGRASQPLRNMLAGINPPGEPPAPPGTKVIELFEGPNAFKDVVAKYGLPPMEDS